MTLPPPPAAQNGASPDPGVPVATSPDCEEVLRSFWDYLDGRCSPEVAGRIDAHVDACPPCRRLRELQERFFDCLAEVGTQWTAPPRVRDRVTRALAAERRAYRL